MRNLTATLCLTIAVFLGSAGEVMAAKTVEIDKQGIWAIQYHEIGIGKLCSLSAVAKGFSNEKADFSFRFSLVNPKKDSFVGITGLWSELKGKRGRDFVPMLAARANLDGKDVGGKLVEQGDQFRINEPIFLSKGGLLKITYMLQDSGLIEHSYNLADAKVLFQRSWKKCQLRL
jgi:hypothetical protein